LERTGGNGRGIKKLSRSCSPNKKETGVSFSYLAPESPPTTAQVIYHAYSLETKGAVNKILAPSGVNNIVETTLSQALPVYKGGDSPPFSPVAGMKRGVSITKGDDEVDKRTREFLRQVTLVEDGHDVVGMMDLYMKSGLASIFRSFFICYYNM
jgi:hypothetical protein